MGVPRTGLHIGTRFSVRSGQNGTDCITLVYTDPPLSVLLLDYNRVRKPSGIEDLPDCSCFYQPAYFFAYCFFMEWKGLPSFLNNGPGLRIHIKAVAS